MGNILLSDIILRDGEIQKCQDAFVVSKIFLVLPKSVNEIHCVCAHHKNDNRNENQHFIFYTQADKLSILVLENRNKFLPQNLPDSKVTIQILMQFRLIAYLMTTKCTME